MQGCADLVDLTVVPRLAHPLTDTRAPQGARTQRCLWANTRTTNPTYRAVLSVAGLSGPDTVDTLPPATIDAFLAQGVVERTRDRGVDEARAALEALEKAGISMDELTLQ